MNKIFSKSAVVLVLSSLLAACGGGSGGGGEFSSLAGNYTVPAVPAAVASAERDVDTDGKVLSASLSADGFIKVQIELDINNGSLFGIPEEITVFGQVDFAEGNSETLEAGVLTGRLNVLGSFLYLQPFREQGKPLNFFGDIEIRAYDDQALFGTITMDNGDEFIVDLALAEAAPVPANAAVAAGYYQDPRLLPGAPELALTITDNGQLMGSLDGVCAVSGSLRPLEQGRTLAYSRDNLEGEESGDFFSYVLNLSVSGCEQAADYDGIVMFERLDDATNEFFPAESLLVLAGNEQGSYEWWLFPE